MSDTSTDPRISELTATVTQSWRRFLEVYEPLRPVLYRFCRYLTRSPWDAEDLVQEERAAVVLKDAFDLGLDEVAEILSTSVGAIKAALHRGRGKLADPDPEVMRTPAPGVLDAFCAAFNARDLDRLTALLLDQATVEVVGASTHHGAARARDTVLTGMLFGSSRMAGPADDGGCEGSDPRFAQGVLPVPPRLELRVHRGEHLLLSWYSHRDGEFVRAVTRVELSADGEQVARIRNYFYTPEVISELCGELDLPWRGNGTFRAR